MSKKMQSSLKKFHIYLKLNNKYNSFFHLYFYMMISFDKMDVSVDALRHAGVRSLKKVGLHILAIQTSGRRLPLARSGSGLSCMDFIWEENKDEKDCHFLCFGTWHDHDKCIYASLCGLRSNQGGAGRRGGPA